MTVRLPAWLQTGSYSAEIDRSVGSSLLFPAGALAGREGVRHFNGNDLKVAATGPATMQVTVSAGTAWVTGDYTATQGSYAIVNDATVTLAVTASSSSQDRVDLVCLQVLDSVYSGSSNLAQLVVVAGTPASPGSAVPPAAPPSAIALAQVLVSKSVTSISSSAITDTRPFIAGAGGVIPVLNATYRLGMSGVPAGSFVMEIDTLRVYQYDGANWVYHLGGNAPTVSITPTNAFLNYTASQGGPWNYLRGVRIGSIVHISGLLITAFAFNGSKTMFTVPTGWAPEKNYITNTIWAGDDDNIRIDVQSDGTVLLNWNGGSIGSGQWVAVDLHYNIKNNTVG